MQDLNRLREVVTNFCDSSTPQAIVDICDAFKKLITRCENAEKLLTESINQFTDEREKAFLQNDEIVRLNDELIKANKYHEEQYIRASNAEKELKELRDKNILDEASLKRAYSLGEQAGIYGESEQRGLWKRAKKCEEDFRSLLSDFSNANS